MKISISLPDDLVSYIDRERGLVSRSAWIASCLRAGGSNPKNSLVRDVFNEAILPPQPKPGDTPFRSRADSFRRATQR